MKKRGEKEKQLKAYEIWSEIEVEKGERMEKVSNEIGVSALTLYKWKKEFDWDKRLNKKRKLEREETEKAMVKAKVRHVKRALDLVDAGMKRVTEHAEDKEAKFRGGLGDALRVGIELVRCEKEALSKVNVSEKKEEHAVVSVVRALAEKGITTETRIVEGDVEALKKLMGKGKKDGADDD